MRQDWHNIDPELRGLLDRLATGIVRLPHVERMVLFGSYAKGTNTETSDVDLAVFFSGADGAPLLEEYRNLVHICTNPGIDIQVQAFDVAELEHPCGIIEEIDAYGVEMPLLAYAAE